MHLDFSHQRVLVSASTGGIGLAVARGFLSAGAHVVINGRSSDSVARALEQLRPAAPSATQVQGFAGDLGTATGCADLVARHPAFDIVVNNLGVYGPLDFFDTPDAEWERVFQTNVMSGVRLARAYAGGMAERGWGRIVFISSESAINIPADMIHYGVSKVAQLAISRGLAKRLAGTGVTVNAVLPGPTLSEGVIHMLDPDGQAGGAELEQLATDFVATHRSSSLLQRAATVEEVASMVLYASSRQASATTGAALRVDGGVIDSIF